MVTEEHQRWLSKLLGYDFEIQYKPGLENKAADALSRKVECSQLIATSVPQLVDWGKLRTENMTSKELGSFREAIRKGEEISAGYTVEDQLLLHKGRLVLPRTSSHIPLILQEFHASAIGGHSGGQKTYQRLAREIYWKGMRKDVEEMVARCDTCQRNKYQACAPGGLLQPLELPDQVWSEVTMDFIEGLPKSDGYTVILVVVDRLSKYAHFIPLRHPFNAPTVAAVFIREIVRLHGFPESIVSDRDKVFLSHFWKEMFKLQGTLLKRSSAYHPQTDGQSEVVNRSVETYLRCFAGEKPKHWVRWLPWAEYWYNTSFHKAAQVTPFKVLYGRDPPTLMPYKSHSTSVSLVEQQLSERDEILGELKKHLLRAQNIMKQAADHHRKDVHFEIGEFVYLKLRPYRQNTLARRLSVKLAPRYYGPYEVDQKIGKVAYRLKLPPTTTIHPVFHVSQLKKFKGDSVPVDPLPPTLSEEGTSLLEPSSLQGVRHTEEGGKEVLIEWKDLPTHDATWEAYESIQAQFPAFNLEDKVNLWAGSDDGPDQPVHPPSTPAQKGPVLVYCRRRTRLPGRSAEGEEGGRVGPRGPPNE
ncbi:hypothetical protein KFK09_004527 [Dendrobium nobile]|uniref:Transposon Tf2-1 polyprotein n=1 Tax=Dendrobium nobile TaxID=94219 RepID=A0A8T3C0P3_DENNO|nr:hypothetical protein KFK09_004527 [Dendrobium nobile]